MVAILDDRPPGWSISDGWPRVAVATDEALRTVLTDRVHELGYEDVESFLSAAEGDELDPLGDELYQLFGHHLR